MPRKPDPKSRRKNVSFMTDEATYERAEAYRNRGEHVQETDSKLFDRICRKGLDAMDDEKEPLGTMKSA